MDDLRKRRREVSEQQVLGEEELCVGLEEEQMKKEEARRWLQKCLLATNCSPKNYKKDLSNVHYLDARVL